MKNIRKIGKSIISLFLVFAVTMSLTSCGIGNKKAQNATEMDTSDIIKKMTHGKPDIVLTVGIYENGRMGYAVYGNNGKELEKNLYDYSIGSITELFTGALLAKEVSQGKMNIEDKLGKYIGIDDSKYTPTLKQLVTHTSGLSDIWSETRRGYNKQEIKNVLLEQGLVAGVNDTVYSGFGAALVGTAVSEVEGKSYKELMQDYINNDLKLKNTKVGGESELDDYLEWTDDDEMMAAYGIISNVDDMLTFGRMNLLNKPAYLVKTHERFTSYDSDNDIGYFWLTDAENDVVWNGSELSVKNDKGENIGHQAFIGYSTSRDRVVVVMSNMVVDDDVFGSYTDLLGYSIMLDE